MFMVFLLFGLCVIPNYIECRPSEVSSSKVMAYDRQWLLLINQIPMANSRYLSQRQIDRLSENVADSEDGQALYAEKMKELKCIYGGIVQRVFNYMDGVLENSQTGEDLAKTGPLLKEFKKYIAKMFSALQLANDRTYPWMWQVYFLLYAVDESNPAEFGATYETNTVLKGDIDAFVDCCISQRYLKPSSSGSALDTFRATNAEKMVVEGLAAAQEPPVQGQTQWTYAYQNADRFAVDRVLLKGLKADNAFQKSRMNGFHKRIKDRLFAVWEAPRSALYLKQVDLVDHHALIAKLIKISIAHFVWMHLYKFYQVKSTVGIQSFMDRLASPLNDAVAFLDTRTDEFYNVLLSNILSKTVSVATLPSLLNKAKQNFVKHFRSLSLHKESVDDVKIIETMTNYDIKLDSNFAADLKGYVDSQKRKLTDFLFKLIDFYKLSQSPVESNLI
ncbi:uncharacterized protein LOC126844633 [Adelges cooleyi]|uniref:uncharacterized protein LOC126844633 n=1 Tax=Adelges cooleyi TaxID=133065 RepID=UPI00217F4FCC|nr:uncharacterized protein LOC126844633 [Adelges cooleyi]